LFNRHVLFCECKYKRKGLRNRVYSIRFKVLTLYLLPFALCLINLKDELSTIAIEKDKFIQLKIGDKIKVEYENHTKTILSIAL